MLVLTIAYIIRLKRFILERHWVIWLASTGLVQGMNWVVYRSWITLSHPIRSEAKTNRDSFARVFPRFASATCIWLKWLPFRKFRSKPEWIGSVQPEKFRKSQSTFRGGPLFSVGPVRSKWTAPFDHSGQFSIPGPRCSVSYMYRMAENIHHRTFMDC